MTVASPGVWLVGSLLFALVASHLGWLVISRVRLAGPVLAALIWFFTSLFLLLPPFAAWQSGALSPYYMGLAELDWVRSCLAGAPLALVIAGVVIGGWLIYRRSIALEPGPEGWARWLQLWRVLWDVSLRQWHWAFYRAAAIGCLSAGLGLSAEPEPLRPLLEALLTRPLYWGSWLGLLLALLEWLLSPATRSILGMSAGSAPVAWDLTGQPEATLRGIAMALATTALFVLTRNFWLCLACDLLVEAAIMGRFSSPSSAR